MRYVKIFSLLAIVTLVTIATAAWLFGDLGESPFDQCVHAMEADGASSAIAIASKEKILTYLIFLSLNSI